QRSGFSYVFPYVLLLLLPRHCNGAVGQCLEIKQSSACMSQDPLASGSAKLEVFFPIKLTASVARGWIDS
ncbi:MAG: hypothetical protein PVG73_10605, partial [Desulfobacterales bacterium]